MTENFKQSNWRTPGATVAYFSDCEFFSGICNSRSDCATFNSSESHIYHLWDGSNVFHSVISLKGALVRTKSDNTCESALQVTNTLSQC